MRGNPVYTEILPEGIHHKKITIDRYYQEKLITYSAVHFNIIYYLKNTAFVVMDVDMKDELFMFVKLDIYDNNENRSVFVNSINVIITKSSYYYYHTVNDLDKMFVLSIRIKEYFSGNNQRAVILFTFYRKKYVISNYYNYKNLNQSSFYNQTTARANNTNIIFNAHVVGIKVIINNTKIHRITYINDNSISQIDVIFSTSRALPTITDQSIHVYFSQKPDDSTGIVIGFRKDSGMASNPERYIDISFDSEESTYRLTPLSVFVTAQYNTSFSYEPLPLITYYNSNNPNIWLFYINAFYKTPVESTYIPPKIPPYGVQIKNIDININQIVPAMYYVITRTNEEQSNHEENGFCTTIFNNTSITDINFIDQTNKNYGNYIAAMYNDPRMWHPYTGKNEITISPNIPDDLAILLASYPTYKTKFAPIYYFSSYFCFPSPLLPPHLFYSLTAYERCSTQPPETIRNQEKRYIENRIIIKPSQEALACSDSNKRSFIIFYAFRHNDQCFTGKSNAIIL